MAERSQGWYGWRRDTPDYRDKVAAAPSFQAAAAQPRKGFVLPSTLPGIRDQGDQGSCTGHAIRGHAMSVKTFGGQPLVELSPAFAYWNARRLEGATRYDAGAEIRDVVKGLVKWGICTESAMRYSPRVYNKAPSTAAYLGALRDMAVEYRRVPQTLVSLKQAILGGAGFVYGFSVYENFETDEVAATGMCGMPNGSDTGGHAVWAVGYDDDLKFPGVARPGGILSANSWNTDWGCAHPAFSKSPKSRGYFWLPYAYVLDQSLAADFWQIQRIT